MWVVLFKSAVGVCCWCGEGAAAALELGGGGEWFLSHDLTKGISKDNRPVLVFSLHTPEKEGLWWSNMWVSLILKGAGGLIVHNFDGRQARSKETCFCCEQQQTKEKISSDRGSIPECIIEVSCTFVMLECTLYILCLRSAGEQVDTCEQMRQKVQKSPIW